MARIGQQAAKDKPRIKHSCVEMTVTCKHCGESQCSVCAVAELEVGRVMWDHLLCSDCLLEWLVRRVQIQDRESRKKMPVEESEEDKTT